MFPLCILPLLMVGTPATALPAPSAQGADSAVRLGERTLIRSEILDEHRELWVWRSPFAARGERLPTIVLLDGPSNFRHTAGMLHTLSATGVVPPCLLVGIGNTDRWRDLTPSHTAEAPTSGGGERFLDFVEQELLPWVDAHHPTSGYRVLVGHSLGGLIGVESLITRPHVFDAIVAESPSLEWDAESAHARMSTWLATQPDVGVRLHLSRANEWELGAPFARITELLKRKAPKGLTWTTDAFPDEDHMSVRVVATLRGLRWVFAAWNPTPAQVAGMAPADVEAFYAAASRCYKVQRPLSENALLEGAAHALYVLDDPERAAELAFFSEDNFPDSPWSALSLAEALERAGEHDEARAAYHRAQERLPVDDAHHRERCRAGLARLPE